MLTFGRWLFRYRNRVFPIVLLGLFVSFRPHLFLGSVQTDLWLDAVGLGVALAGQWLRATVVGFAYIKRGGVNKQVYADSLVTAGLFAHGRNPLYVGNLMILAGLFLIFNNPWVYVLGGIFFGLGYIAIVQTEEDFLSKKFGDEYRAYCARVSRWLVQFDGIAVTLADMEFDWRRVLSKELASAVVWWLTAMGLIAAEAWVNSSSLSSVRAATVAASAAIAIVFLLLARVAKHRGWLNKSAA